MPEFAEVYHQVRYLREHCQGWEIKEMGLPPSSWSHFQNLPEATRSATVQAFFQDNVLDTITQRGKHVVIRMRKGTLLSHLMFKGRWSVAGEPFLSNYKHHKKPPTEKSKNFWMINKQGQELHFYEPEYKGKITLFPGQLPGELEEMKRLGPEVLVTDLTEPDFSEHEWQTEDLIQTAARSGQAIKVFLLDQKRQAGLGNMYVCETLYAAGIAPERPAKELKAEECKRIVFEAKAILRSSIESQLDYDQVLKIYKKDKDPHGNAIVEADVGGRDTYWVPTLQR